MTQHINTGGPAFPCVCTNDGYEEINGFNHDVIPAGTACQYRGLTMRDWFAGKAMQGMLAASENYPTPELADYAYQVADAMLRAREAKQ